MLSLVIPVYNEADSLRELHAELDRVAREQGYDCEIIWVDDGSTDGSWETICQLAAADPRVRGLRFRRNFGKAAALNAGFREVRGDADAVFTLDADLQDDPGEIPRFLEQLDAGRDVVSGWKQVRHDPWHKVGPSRVFNWLVGALTGVKLHDHNCGFKCYRRPVLDDIQLYGERHRFIPVLAAARGWRVGEIPIHHRPRKFGHSKYGVARFVKGFLDLLTVRFLTGYGQRPQHILGTLGLICFFLGGLGALLLAGWWIGSRLDSVSQNDLHLHTRAIFYYALAAMLLGAQLVTAGFLAELLTAHQMRDAVPFSIRDRTDTGPGSAPQALSERLAAARPPPLAAHPAPSPPAAPRWMPPARRPWLSSARTTTIHPTRSCRSGDHAEFRSRPATPPRRRRAADPGRRGHAHRPRPDGPLGARQVPAAERQ